jgi:hypothetical protein
MRALQLAEEATVTIIRIGNIRIPSFAQPEHIYGTALRHGTHSINPQPARLAGIFVYALDSH